jgi:heat shock protein HslJ
MRWYSRFPLNLTLTGIFTFVSLVACSPPQDNADMKSPVQVEQPAVIVAPAPPSASELANMSYTGINENTVTLQDGRWEGKPFVEGGASRPVIGLVSDLQLTGDLDDDGVDEVVVFLRESSGGSGTFSHVAVAGKREGKSINLGTAPIGDRVQVRSGQIQDGVIKLDLVQQGAGDAACCPSQNTRRYWTLGTDGLHEGAAQITGTATFQDIMGKEWHLIRPDREEPGPDAPEVTLSFDGKRLTGNSGCNRYFAGVTEGGIPGDLTIGMIGGTRMACPGEVMELESRYLESLGNVIKYGFLNGQLALTWQQDGITKTLLFK